MTFAPRTFSHSLAAWIFGLSTSVLLISVWGRAVVGDPGALSEAAAPLARSSVIAERVDRWLVTQLTIQGVTSPIAESAVAVMEEDGALDAVIANLVDQGVDALTSEDPDGAAIDMAAAFEPAVPAMTGALVVAGLPVSQDVVAVWVGALDPLRVRDPAKATFLGPQSTVYSRLGTATLIGLLGMAFSAAVFVAASPDWRRAGRSLLFRLGLSGASFAVLLKLGAWILDPRGGRAPVSEALSLLADAKWAFPGVIGGVALGVGAVLWLARSSREPVLQEA